MKSRVLPFIAILFLFGAAAAQSPDKILKQSVKALGGKAVENVRSSVRQGVITRTDTGATGSFLLQTSAPNLYHTRFDIAGFETEFGYNGKSSWLRDSGEGLRTLTGTSSVHMQTEAAFRNGRWLSYKKDKTKAVSCGRTDVGGKAANCVAFTTSKGVTIRVHFDASTFLPLREEIPMGETTRTIDYGDYRPVNGVQEPFSLEMRMGEVLYRIQLSEVSSNVTVARSDFDFPKMSSEPLPDIPTLLKDIQANEDRVEDMLENYSYTQKVIRREVGKDGILREVGSETTQLSFYKGYRITRLIERDGRPLSPKDQEEEDKEVQKRVEEIEKRIKKEEKREVAQSAAGPPNGEGRRVSIAEVLRASNLINPRRERFRGRDVIVFDFEPNPNFDYRNAKSFLKFFGKCAGVMWIDEKDKQVARIDAVLFESYKVGGGILANLRKGASFTLEQERVNDEIWLPSSADINLSVKVLLVKGINVNSVIKSFNYSKFNTQVTDASVLDVKK